jgi:hypothetical protein
MKSNITENQIYNESLSNAQIKNKKLVNVLKHKIFRGYLDIKNSKTFYRKRPKCVKIIDFEEQNLEPFDDNYNLQYKRTFLSTLNQQNIMNPFIIHNFSPSKTTNENIENEKIGKKEKMSQTVNQYNRNFFMTNTKVPKKKKDYQYNKIISDRNRVIFKEMFKDEDEAKIYSNIPFLYVERAIQIPENPNEKLIMSEGKEFDEYDGLTENQFIYKISHKNYQPNPDLNSFKTNKGVKRGFVSRELKSAVNRNKNNFNLYSNSYKDLNINNAIIENDLNNLNSIDKGKRCLSGIINNKTRNLSTFSQNKNNKGESINKNNIKSEVYNQSINNKTEVNSNRNNNQSNTNSYKKHNVYSYSIESYEIPNKGNLKINLKKSNKNTIRLNLNKYNTFDKEYRIITNQPLIDEKHYKKYKFNLLKGLMQGTIESKK